MIEIFSSTNEAQHEEMYQRWEFCKGFKLVFCPSMENGDAMREILGGLTYPLVQAPMAGAQDWRLAQAVARAGGLGSLPAAMFSHEALAAQLAAWFEQMGQTPLNVNFFAHRQPEITAAQRAAWEKALQPILARLGIEPSDIAPDAGRAPFDEQALEIVCAYRPAVVSFHFGLPEKRFLDALRGTGCRIMASATTLEEARYLAAHKVDAVIVQGLEAGGHRGWFLTQQVRTQSGMSALLSQVVREIRLPVIAAGGISDAAGTRSALDSGAAAVQAGTAFLLADEACISAEHRAALQSDLAQTTALTNVFSGGVARGMMTRMMQQLGCLNDLALPFPLGGAYAAAIKHTAQAQGLQGYASLWAGQNAPLCRAGSAAEIVQRLFQAA